MSKPECARRRRYAGRTYYRVPAGPLHQILGLQPPEVATYSIGEACALLGFTENWGRRAAATGRFPSPVIKIAAPAAS